jgi:hypothetical protein
VGEGVLVCPGVVSGDGVRFGVGVFRVGVVRILGWRVTCCLSWTVTAVVSAGGDVGLSIVSGSGTALQEDSRDVANSSQNEINNIGDEPVRKSVRLMKAMLKSIQSGVTNYR